MSLKAPRLRIEAVGMRRTQVPSRRCGGRQIWPSEKRGRKNEIEAKRYPGPCGVYFLDELLA